MSSPISQDQYLADLKAFFADPYNQDLIVEMFSDLPDVMQQWLGSSCLLYGAPFNNLVIDDRMLPQESIRFFYVDHNWLDALVDGVFSIGVHSSRNTAFIQLLTEAIRETAEAELPLVRSRLQGAPPPANILVGGTMTGLLMRSAAVSGWPGLVVKAYGQSGEEQLPLLRMDRLAPDILLCIFMGVPAKVEIAEPPEGLHFGVEDNDLITLRGLGYGGFTAGVPIQIHSSPPTATAVYRSQDTRVLDIIATQAALKAELENLGALAPSSPAQPLGAADFAIQMVQAPEQQAFVNE
jgi:hypothetical protein